jgi:hypothetical protein
MLAPVSAHLRRKGFLLQKAEMPFHEYAIDLYAYSPADHMTVAVELKVEKWQRAIEQAQIYQLCADVVYIAMPTETCPRVDRMALTSRGIGLLGVAANGRCLASVKPRRSEQLYQCYRRAFICRLKREG